MYSVKIICCVCGSLIRTEQWPNDPGGPSHGLCDALWCRHEMGFHRLHKRRSIKRRRAWVVGADGEKKMS